MNIYISIIIPIFNVEQYLRECLDSIVIQNSNKVEIIMVNDGSSDKSEEIAKEYSEKYENFILINKVNGGLSSARNTGLENANGKYIMYLDSDDYFNSNAIEKIISIINLEDVDLIYFSGIKLFDNIEKGKYNVQNYGSICEKSICSGLKLYKDLIEQESYFTGVYYQVVKKDLLSDYNIKFINGIIHEDHLYTYQVFSVAEKAISIKDKLYVYRVRENSIMTSKRNYYKRFEAFAITFNKMVEWNNNIICKCNDKKTKELIINHQNNMALEAIKSYIKIDNYNNMKNEQIENDFWNMLKKYKYKNLKINMLSKTYCIINKIYKWCDLL